jgi:dTDP-glucose 4,6-dehydratase
MTSIAVTGGAGFIGSAMVRRLLRASHDRVVVVDALTYAGCRENLPADEPRLAFVHRDIGDRRGMLELLQQHQCRAIVNLAAETHVDRSIDRPAAFIHANVTGVLELLEAATGYWQGLPAERAAAFRFLQVSTDEVYGSIPQPRRAKVGEAYAPSSPYSASKAAADHLVHSYHATFGLPTVVAMLTNCYGPRQFPEKLVPLMVSRAAASESLPLYGDGRNVREWLHVDDAARGLHRVLDAATPGETHHLRGDDVLENRELLDRLCVCLDELLPAQQGRSTRDLIEHVADRPGHDRRYSLDDAASREQLDWRPEIALDEGLPETVRWFLKQDAWVNRALHRAMYHKERLGLRAADVGR